jgi:hypothetical protein
MAGWPPRHVTRGTWVTVRPCSAEPAATRSPRHRGAVLSVLPVSYRVLTESSAWRGPSGAACRRHASGGGYGRDWRRIRPVIRKRWWAGSGSGGRRRWPRSRSATSCPWEFLCGLAKQDALEGLLLPTFWGILGVESSCCAVTDWF